MQSVGKFIDTYVHSAVRALIDEKVSLGVKSFVNGIWIRPNKIPCDLIFVIVRAHHWKIWNMYERGFQSEIFRSCENRLNPCVNIWDK
jgi:hypothetical protein